VVLKELEPEGGQNTKFVIVCVVIFIVTLFGVTAIIVVMCRRETMEHGGPPRIVVDKVLRTDVSVDQGAISERDLAL
jgi:hypothetical protein